MNEQSCPYCQQPNSLQSAYCSHCGASFDKYPVSLPRHNPVSVAGYDVTSRQLKQIGASVAVSIIALLAEAGMIWLHRRVQHMRNVSPMLPSTNKLTKHNTQDLLLLPAKNDEKTITVYRERVVEIRRWGRPMKRVIERVILKQELKN